MSEKRLAIGPDGRIVWHLRFYAPGKDPENRALFLKPQGILPGESVPADDYFQKAVITVRAWGIPGEIEFEVTKFEPYGSADNMNTVRLEVRPLPGSYTSNAALGTQKPWLAKIVILWPDGVTEHFHRSPDKSQGFVCVKRELGSTAQSAVHKG